jgi:hypothetical protein
MNRLRLDVEMTSAPIYFREEGLGNVYAGRHEFEVTSSHDHAHSASEDALHAVLAAEILALVHTRERIAVLQNQITVPPHGPWQQCELRGPTPNQGAQCSRCRLLGGVKPNASVFQDDWTARHRGSRVVD